MNVHPFGCNLIPCNPDNVPENEPYGQGSERPIGLSFTEIFKLVWTVRSFNCSFTTVSQTDPLSQFLLSGGSSFGILGATLALNNVNLNGTDAVIGNTSISTSFKQKQRVGLRSGSDVQRIIYTWDGVQKGETITKISLGQNQKTFSNNNKTVYEGNLIIGPVHALTGKVIIDFSNIKFYRGLYWPRILITTGSASSKLTGPKLLGGISFNGSLVNMYSSNTNPLTTVRVAFGDITIGKRCCDRFFYDGKDKLRVDSSSCPDCKKYQEQYKNF